MSQAERVATFHALHESGCFVIPNPWDVGTARTLEQMGFPALATTSAGLAWSLGRADNQISFAAELEHLRIICAAVDLPVNADFEDGFAREPADVAANVTAAIATGIAGLSIEDSTRDGGDPLYELPFAVERIRAARSAIDASGTGVLLVGRSEGFVVGRPDLDETIRRLLAYSEAGADCLYAPRLRTADEIRAVVEACAPKPVNVLAGSEVASVAEMSALGVRRISVGGQLARAAWAGFLSAVSEIADDGTFGWLAHATPGAELDARFADD